MPSDNGNNAELSIHDDDFEEITSEEVDRVVDALEALAETVSSENIKAYLEEASSNIFYLLYDEDETGREGGTDCLADAA